MASAQHPVDLHASRVNQILVPAILCPALATVTILLRVYTRFVLVKAPALDDLFAIFALILSIGNTISQVYEVKNGFGKHVATLTPGQIVRSLQSLYASIILYNLALTCIKISILLLYLRLFCTQMAKRICYVLLAIMVAYGIETLLSGIFTCTPISFFWNLKIPGGKCVDKTTLYYANAGISIITDVALFFIPTIFLRRLAMPRLQKIIVMLIVAFGALACVASALRLRTLYVSTRSKDVTWDKTGTVYWSTIEINVGIICSSLTTLRAMVSRLFPNLFKYNERVPASTVVPNDRGRISDPEVAKIPTYESAEGTDSGLERKGDQTP